VAAALLLAACGSSASGGTNSASSGSAKGTAVKVDVGDGTPITLPAGPLKIGLLYSGAGTSWNETLSEAAVAEGKKYGYNVTVINPAWDVNQQLDQALTAATTKQYNVIGVEPIVAQQLCNVMTKTLPAAGVLTIALGTPCNTNMNPAGDGLWVPGLMTTIAGDTTITYARAFLQTAAEKNPGAQQVAIVTGPQLDPLSEALKEVVTEMAATNPDFKVKFIYTDWTTPTALTDTQDFLSANPDTTLILSAYSPDVTRGVIGALTALGKVGKIKVADEGATTYTVAQIKAGAIQFSMPYFPENYGTLFIQAIHDAQMGKTVPRFISVIPSKYGTVTDPVVITAGNVDSYTPGY
jgi:ABC-type sugar transport system substrate-binding protein